MLSWPHRLSWLLLLAAVLATPAASAETRDAVTLGVDASSRQTLDQGQLAVLRDPGGTLTLADVRAADAAGRFTRLQGNLGAGYTNDVYWLRFHVRAQHDTRGSDEWWLEILPPFLDEVQLYLVQPDGIITAKRSGDLVPRSGRELDHNALLFRLELPTGDSTGYLRVSTTSSMVVVASVWREPALMRVSFMQYLLFGLYLGLIGAILVLIAINWLLLREPLFLLYLAYLGMQVLYGLAFSGLAGQYMFPQMPEIPDMLVGMCTAMTVVFGIAFFDRMLDLADGHPHVRRLFLVTMLLAIVTAVAAVTGWYTRIIPGLLAMILIAILFSLPVAISRVLHGTPTQRLAGGAFIAYAVFVLASSLAYSGILPITRFSMFSAQIGNLAHLFLLHAAIVLRTRDGERERALLAQQADTARRDADQERRQRDEHDRFLSMIAHEIRTPVAVIDAAAQSLHMLDDQPSSARNTRYARIHRAVRRLNLLLEIALNQVRPGQSISSVGQSSDLNVLTRDVIAQFEVPNEQQLNLWMASETALTTGRSDLLRFVFLNLLDNACKYSPPRSQVDIEVLAASRDGRAGQLWRITDGGPGIEPRERELVFDKYYRGGERTATAGLGLGLYIARHIASQTGGTLSCVDPPPGRGACFECWLPTPPIR